MAIEGMTLIGFEQTWDMLNLDLYNNNNMLYNEYLAVLEIEKFNKGFKLKKVGKATRKGTKIKFEAIKDEAEYKKLRADLMERHKEFIKQ